MKDVLYSDCQKESFMTLLLRNACQSAGKQKQLSSSASANIKWRACTDFITSEVSVGLGILA